MTIQIGGKTMNKKEIGAKPFLYPMTITIIGANVNGKPNYIPIAYIGIVQHSPALIALGMGKAHYTNQGIKENGTFSVNLPSQEMLKVTDYIGIYSGKKIDKSELFTNFYGELKTAPMIEECPLNLECKLVEALDLGGTNEIFIGEIVAVYAEEKYLMKDLPDIKKIKPIAFSMHDNNYWAIGDHLGKAWSIGRTYTKK